MIQTTHHGFKSDEGGFANLQIPPDLPHNSLAYIHPTSIMKKILLSCLILIPLAISVCGQEESKTMHPKVDPTVSRELIRQWVKTERLISEEKSAWKVEKQRMQDLLGLYQKELKLLSEEIADAGSSVDFVDEEKKKYETELKQYREAQQLLRVAMARFLPRMKILMSRFPQPLIGELTTEVDLLSSPEALKKPRDVLKSMIAVLTTTDRFNRSITIAEETRKLPDGKKMTANVIYLGLCRAYYATSSGDTAGIGIPGEDGWTWKSEPGIADDVRRAMAVYQKSEQPQLVKLPVKVTGAGEGK